LVWLGYAAGAEPAVPPTTTSTGELAATQDVGDDPTSTEGLSARLKEQMRRLRETREAVIAADQDSLPDHSDTAPTENRRLRQLRRELIEQQAIWQKRHDRLNADLSRLEALFQDSQRGHPAADIPQTPPTPPDPTTAAPNNEPLQSTESTAADGSGGSPSLIRPGPTTLPMDASSGPDSEAIPPALVEAIAVTDQPVDRMGLANNLYGTGEYNLALQIYQRIDTGSLPPVDQEWVYYQIANCHRQLGHTAEAERGFRIVTAGRQEGWCNQNARWWLETNTKLSQLRQRVEQIQQILETLGEEPRVSAKPF
jgi:hypothetical protein